jgi:hypothetical protein
MPCLVASSRPQAPPSRAKLPTVASEAAELIPGALLRARALVAVARQVDTAAGPAAGAGVAHLCVFPGSDKGGDNFGRDGVHITSGVAASDGHVDTPHQDQGRGSGAQRESDCPAQSP